MKVILIEDVKSLGKKGELVNVNDGYARNYILAKKLGVEATPKNLNDLKLKKSKEIAQAAQEQLGVELDKKKMQLPSPIKSVGTQMVPIRLHPKVTAQLKVNVREA